MVIVPYAHHLFPPITPISFPRVCLCEGAEPVENHRRLLHDAVHPNDDRPIQRLKTSFRMDDTPGANDDLPSKVDVLTNQRGGMSCDFGETFDSLSTLSLALR